MRQATDIVGLISEHLALRKVGRRWVGLCPFHQENTPSFSVNAEEGVYHCFGCHASGDAISFLRSVEHLDFVDAVERLASRAHITLHDSASPADAARKRRREQLYAVMEAAVDYYHHQLHSSKEGERALSYLASRGYGESTVSTFRLGYSPEDFDALVRALSFSPPLLVEAGLGYMNRRGRFQDAFRGRVLFPIFDAGGHPVAFGGRVIPGHPPGGDTAAPKYKNSSETPIYSKRRTLYGLNWAKSDVAATGEIVVCEGYTDVIGCFQAGIPRAVATCGTALADEHFATLRKFARRIVLAYDADSAGQAGAERVYAWERAHDVEVAVAALPNGSDPGELASADPEALTRAIAGAKQFAGFRIDRLLAGADLATGEGRARAFESALPIIAEHPNELVRDHYLMVVVSRTGVDQHRARELLARQLRSRKTSPGTGPARSRPSPGTGPARSERSPGTGPARSESSPGTGPARSERSPGTGPARSENSPGSPSTSGPPVSLAPEEPLGEPPEHSRRQPPEEPLGEPPTIRTGTGPGTTRPVTAPINRLEAEAIRIMISHPQSLPTPLHSCLFGEPALRECFRHLADAHGELSTAMSAASEGTAALLGRFAVEEPTADGDELWRRLIEAAALRQLKESDREIHLFPERFAEIESERVSVRRAIQEMRATRDPGAARTAGELLLGWLIEGAPGETMNRTTDQVSTA